MLCSPTDFDIPEHAGAHARSCDPHGSSSAGAQKRTAEALVGLAGQLLGMPVASLCRWTGAAFEPWIQRGRLFIAGSPCCGRCTRPHAEDTVFVPDLPAPEGDRGCPGVPGGFVQRSFARSVLRSSRGEALGALCAMSDRARGFSDPQRASFCAVAACVRAELEVASAAGRIGPVGMDPEGEQADAIDALVRDPAVLGVSSRGPLVDVDDFARRLAATVAAISRADLFSIEERIAPGLVRWRAGVGEGSPERLVRRLRPDGVAAAALENGQPAYWGPSCPVGRRSGPAPFRRGGADCGLAVPYGPPGAPSGVLVAGFRGLRRVPRAVPELLESAGGLLHAVGSRRDARLNLAAFLRETAETGAHVATLRLDASGRIRSVGPTAAAMIGWRENALLGRRYRTILAGEPPEGLFEPAGGPGSLPRLADLPVRTARGALLWCEAAVLPAERRPRHTSPPGRADRRGADGRDPGSRAEDEETGVLLLSDAGARVHLSELLRMAESKAEGPRNEGSPGVALIDAEGRILAANDEWPTPVGESACPGCPLATLSGLERSAPCDGMSASCGLPASGFGAGLRAITRNAEREFRTEVPCGSAASRRWYELRVIRLQGADPVVAWIARRDVSERRRIEDALRQSEDAARHLLEGAGEGIFTADEEGRVVSFNPAACMIFGCREEADVLGRPIAELVPLLAGPGSPGAEEDAAESVSDASASTAPVRGPGSLGRPQETMGRRRDGSFVPLALRARRWRHSDGRILRTAIVRDLSDEKRAEEQVTQLAYYDLLTRLPNRMLFRDRMELALSQAQRRGHRAGILVLDVDRFKLLNDGLGHRAGDRFLCEVGRRLSEVIGVGNTLARSGGDEFLCLLAEVSRPEEVARMGRAMIDALRPPFRIEGREIFASASVGGSVSPEDGEEGDTLLQNAEMAMYRAKHLGGASCQLYTAAMNQRWRDQVALEGELHGAVRRREFTVHYQPEVDVGTGEVVGVEALVRWKHPAKGMVPPNRFIPTAETTGLIVPMGLQVLEQVCRQLRRWQAAGVPRMRVAVNLSLIQLKHGGLVRRVRRIVSQTGVDPTWLDLEITESVAIDAVRSALGRLQALKALGIRLSLDDFGQGHSSVNHLKHLPIDTLKIDRAFVRTATEDPRDAAIIRGVIGLAHALDLRVVGEGVDRPEQLEFLRREGCDTYQGYLFSKPVPADEIDAMLAEGAGTAGAAGLAGVQGNRAA